MEYGIANPSEIEFLITNENNFYYQPNPIAFVCEKLSWAPRRNNHESILFFRASFFRAAHAVEYSNLDERIRSINLRR
jgi:hypothetical protein